MSLFQQWFALFVMSILMVGIYDSSGRKGSAFFWVLMVMLTGTCAVVTSR